jgi:hypothetical protein
VTEWEDSEREVSLAVSTPSLWGVLPTATASYLKRQTARGDDFIADIEADSDWTREDVEGLLTRDSDGPRVNIIEEIFATVARTADRGRIANLARVAVNIMNGDDAVIQRTAVLLDTLLLLQPPHVALLATFRHWAYKQNQGTIGEARALEDTCEDEATLTALVAQLVSMGAIEYANVYDGKGPPVITDFGNAVVEYLLEAGIVDVSQLR